MIETEAAYLAGIVDADGYVTASRVQRNARWYFGAQVGITGSSREPHDLAANVFGGGVSAHAPKNDRAHHRPQYHWQRTGRQAVPVIEALLPYLRIKAERAMLVLELQEEVDRMKLMADDPFPWFPPDHDPAIMLSALVDDIRSHNSRRGRLITPGK